MRKKAPLTLQKSPTGIEGLDEITGGGLPTGRPTLVCGGAGCGKTMLATEFLVCGATKYDEPGVFVMFEETPSDLTKNSRSLGFDLDDLVAQKKIILDYVRIERSEVEETGEYDLEGLFIRLGHAVDSIGAKRVVLDTVEALFAGLPNHAILRAELRRLFGWLKDRGLTSIVTGERGATTLTRYGLEEYVADCVIELDQRMRDQISTRQLRVLKYRGSTHGTNEYPFLIGERGISVFPITSLRLDHAASEERVSSGIPRLDEMLDGKGYYRGSSVLVSGSPGTGKSSLGATFIDAACRRGERASLFAYEESAPQVLRNMRSIGIDLAPWVKRGLLQIHASRPTLYGLEQHLVAMHDTVREFDSSVVVVDPISNLTMDLNELTVKPTLMRLIDFLKQRQITALFTSLTTGGDALHALEDSQVGVSSLMDAWLLLRNVEHDGERNRTIFVLKSRGMPHSNQVREFVLSNSGFELIDAYLGTDGAYTGSARVAQQTLERNAAARHQQEYDRNVRVLASKRKALQAQIASLRAAAEAEDAEMEFLLAEERLLDENAQLSTEVMKQQRGRGNVASPGGKSSSPRAKAKR